MDKCCTACRKTSIESLTLNTHNLPLFDFKNLAADVTTVTDESSACAGFKYLFYESTLSSPKSEQKCTNLPFIV